MRDISGIKILACKKANNEQDPNMRKRCSELQQFRKTPTLKYLYTRS